MTRWFSDCCEARIEEVEDKNDKIIYYKCLKCGQKCSLEIKRVKGRINF